MNRNEIYEKIAAKIIANLEEAKSWSRMWSSSNPISLEGREYSGMNRLLLSCSGYSSNVFGTFHQVMEHGGVVRKGEKGHFVLFWKINNSIDEDTKEVKIWLMERYYYVFNTDQCDFDEKGKAYLNKLLATKHDNKSIQSAEDIVAGIPYNIEIEHTSLIQYPSYSPIMDKIRIFPMNQFHSSNDYYSVLFHELVHSTGHPKRLGRINTDKFNGFGSHEYSKEELVAEFGSVFLCEIAGIEPNIDSSAAYIRSWSEALKGNPDWVVSAVSKARMAIDILITV